MKTLTRVTLVAAIAATISTAAFAQQSKKAADFCSGPAKWIMTDAETSQCKSLATDDAAQAFIDLFWARRDPTPGTPANEYHDRFDALVAAADQRFASGRTKGSLTELGHVLIVLGPPQRMQRSEPSAASSTSRTGTGTDVLAGGNPEDAVTGTANRQLWIYEKPKTNLPFVGNEFDVSFFDQFGNNDYKIARGGKYNAAELMKQAVDATIVSPNLTEAPKPGPGTTQTTTRTTTTTTTTVTQPVAVAAPTASLKTDALKAAVTAQAGGTSTINRNTSASYAEFVSPSGDFYVPLGIYVNKAAGLAPDAIDTVFGQVTDSTGNVVQSFEEKATPLASTGGLFTDYAVSLPTGKYNAVIGVAKAGVPVAITSETIEVTNVAKDAAGTSKLILTNNLATMEKADAEKTGFSFGKMKLVPANTFSKNEDLTFFIEIHNPGIDPATNAPKLQTKLEFSGGKLPKPIPRQLMDTPAAPLSGKPGPGQYAIIDGIPLGQIPGLVPGDYTLKVKVVDTVTKQTYELSQSFKITG